MQACNQQFKVGDKAIYPSRGVAEVVSIEEKAIAGASQQYYVLKVLDNMPQTIHVPVANARNVGLRPPITEQETTDVFEILKEETFTVDTQTWNRRQRGFNDKINTGSVYDVAEVLRDLYRLKATKPALSRGETKMLEKARDLLVKEIAVVRKRSEDKIQAEIEAVFESN